MDLLDKLSKLKLKQPKGLRKYIYEETNYLYESSYYRYGCVEVMEKWRGHWILRVFAFNLKVEERTYQNIEIMEVQRKLFGFKEYLSSGNVDCIPMAGRRVYWNEPENNFYRVKTNWEFHGYEMYNSQEVIDDLNLPYCCWDIVSETPLYKNGHIRLIDYLYMYQSDPRIERLVKLGLTEYLPSLRYLDLSKRKIYDVFKLDRRWEEQIGKLPMSDIFKLRKTKLKTIEEFNLHEYIYNNRWTRSDNISKFATFNKLSAYLKKNGMSKKDIPEYEDYLGFADKLGLNMKDNRVLYPNNLKEAHDSTFKQLEVIKTDHLKEGFKKQYKKFKKHTFKNSNLLIVPVENPDQLITESQVLNHCVRTYAEEVAKGDTEILFVREVQSKETPFITVEVKNKRVVQVRGQDNSSPSEEIKSFLFDWSQKKGIRYEI